MLKPMPGPDMTGVIAVTGATGFIGRTLVEKLLAEGWQVRALTRRLLAPLPGPAGPVEVVLGEIGERQALAKLVRGANAVVNLAGLVKAHSRAQFMAVNRDGTVNLLGAMAAHAPAARLVHLSSLTAREPGLSAYAASKRAGEDAVLADGRAFLAIRAPAVYGPGDEETLKFFKLIARGVSLVPGDGQGRLSLIHVEDLAAAIAAALRQGWRGDGVVEIDDGFAQGYSLRQMAAEAASVLNRRIRTFGGPRWAMTGFGILAQVHAWVSGQANILSPGKAREMFHRDWVARDPKLGTRLNWQPQYDLHKGFAQTIAWYKARNWL